MNGISFLRPSYPVILTACMSFRQDSKTVISRLCLHPYSWSFSFRGSGCLASAASAPGQVAHGWRVKAEGAAETSQLQMTLSHAVVLTQSAATQPVTPAQPVSHHSPTIARARRHTPGLCHPAGAPTNKSHLRRRGRAAPPPHTPTPGCATAAGTGDGARPHPRRSHARLRLGHCPALTRPRSPALTPRRCCPRSRRPGSASGLLARSSSLTDTRRPIPR